MLAALLKCWSSAFLFIRPHPTKGITQKIEHIKDNCSRKRACY
nr:Hypothetical protein [Escherichia coli]